MKCWEKKCWENLKRLGNRRITLAALLLLPGLLLQLHSQTPAPASSVVGVVTKIDVDAHQIVLKTDAGAEIAVAVQPKAGFRKVAPGETDLRNAPTIAMTDVNAGDRVLARGKSSDDKKSMEANLIVVMSKADIANKQAQEKADWDKRGVMGVVSSASADQIVVSVRGAAGNTSLTVVPGKDAVVRRYAPDSVKFADAKPAKIADIKAGDQVRVRGDKSEDGKTMTADEIVSGSFHTIAATINGIDAASNTLRVTNLDGKKPLVVKVNPDSVLHQLPAQMAQMLAARNRAPEGGAPLASAAPPAGAEAGGRGGRGGGFGGGAGGGRAGGDLQQMLERAPKITLADLKNGDAIIVSSTEGTTPNQITAITLVSGVEPILTAPGRKDMALGSWSLDMEGGGQ
jgi:co-chaperonin GroES (HSP10)/transcription antitermination factor NusG